MRKQILYIFYILFPITVVAQVGIGTKDPQADLHVAGSSLFQGETSVQQIATVNGTDEDFKLMSWVFNSSPQGQVKTMNTDVINIAPVNTFEYKFTNLSSDNLTDVDLQFSTARYIVTVANFRYIGDAIDMQAAGNRKVIGNFVARTFEQNGTWHLEIRNRELDLAPSKSVSYEMTLVVYDKNYFKNLTIIKTDLGGQNNGIVPAPIELN